MAKYNKFNRLQINNTAQTLMLFNKHTYLSTRESQNAQNLIFEKPVDVVKNLPNWDNFAALVDRSGPSFKTNNDWPKVPGQILHCAWILQSDLDATYN